MELVRGKAIALGCDPGRLDLAALSKAGFARLAPHLPNTQFLDTQFLVAVTLVRILRCSLGSSG